MDEVLLTVSVYPACAKEKILYEIVLYAPLTRELALAVEIDRIGLVFLDIQFKYRIQRGIRRKGCCGR